MLPSGQLEGIKNHINTLSFQLQLLFQINYTMQLWMWYAGPSIYSKTVFSIC